MPTPRLSEAAVVLPPGFTSDGTTYAVAFNGVAGATPETNGIGLWRTNSHTQLK